MKQAAKRIMIVDDEPDITYLVGFMLSSAGFEVTQLNDAREALPRLMEREHALLILDLMMPEPDGFEVLEAVRAEESLKRIPVLIISCRILTQAESRRVADLGAEVMAKPFETHRLLEKVREIVAE